MKNRNLYSFCLTSGYSHDHDVRTADLRGGVTLFKSPTAPPHPWERRVRDALDGKRKLKAIFGGFVPSKCRQCVRRVVSGCC